MKFETLDELSNPELSGLGIIPRSGGYKLPVIRSGNGYQGKNGKN
jgi:hypothetical protein